MQPKEFFGWLCKSQQDATFCLFLIRNLFFLRDKNLSHSQSLIKNTYFQKRKTGDFYEDTEAKEEIKKRLLYLAYKAGGDWKETYQRNASFLDACDICSCEQIDYFYDENISTTRLSFIEDDDKLWYVGS